MLATVSRETRASALEKVFGTGRYLLEVREPRSAYFPMHAICVYPRTNEDGTPAFFTVRQMRVAELDLEYEPTSDDLTLQLSRDTQFQDGVDRRATKDPLQVPCHRAGARVRRGTRVALQEASRGKASADRGTTAAGGTCSKSICAASKPSSPATLGACTRPPPSPASAHIRIFRRPRRRRGYLWAASRRHRSRTPK